jgi:hypothetical protein
MNSKLNELRLDAGIARIENHQWLCVLDKETGMMIDPLIGLEKFAQLIVKECLAQADNIREGCEVDGEDEQALGADWVGLAIARHFGVEV